MGADAGTTLREDRWAVRAVKAANVCFSRIYHHVEILAPPRLPRQGAAILVCNHTSGLDPLLIQSACRRLIVWMMAKEYYEVKWLRPLYQLVEAIPVDRDRPDMAATRSALRALAAGRVLGVFPEGRIERDRNLIPFQSGVAVLALRTGAPVFPAYLDGSQRGKEMVAAVGERNEATLRFGPEIELDRSASGRDGVAETTRRIESAVRKLSIMRRRR